MPRELFRDQKRVVPRGWSAVAHQLMARTGTEVPSTFLLVGTQLWYLLRSQVRVYEFPTTYTHKFYKMSISVSSTGNALSQMRVFIVYIHIEMYVYQSGLLQDILVLHFRIFSIISLSRYDLQKLGIIDRIQKIQKFKLKISYWVVNTFFE